MGMQLQLFCLPARSYDPTRVPIKLTLYRIYMFKNWPKGENHRPWSCCQVVKVVKRHQWYNRRDTMKQVMSQAYGAQRVWRQEDERGWWYKACYIRCCDVWRYEWEQTTRHRKQIDHSKASSALLLTKRRTFFLNAIYEGKQKHQTGVKRSKTMTHTSKVCPDFLRGVHICGTIEVRRVRG